jgi:hypothetical protein
VATPNRARRGRGNIGRESECARFASELAGQTKQKREGTVYIAEGKPCAVVEGVGGNRGQVLESKGSRNIKADSFRPLGKGGRN